MRVLHLDVDTLRADHAREDHWFLRVSVWDPHTPCRTPRGFGDPWMTRPEAG
jgi:hypothetical protein